MYAVALGGWLSLTNLCFAAVEWPQFRGPEGDGHALATGLPTEWSETDGIVWKAAIPGRGWSSPVIGDGLVWVTTAVEHSVTQAERSEIAKNKLAGNPMVDQMTIVGSITLRAVAVSLETSKIVHNVHLFDVKDPQPVHSLNSYASPTPVLVDQRLICHFGTFGTACVNTTDGKVLWKADLPLDHSVGPGSSPIVFEDRVIIPCDGADVQFVAALDLLTGKPIWKTPRPAMTGDKGDMHKAFSTPYLTVVNGQPQAVIVGAQWVVAYEPRTGQEIWKLNYGVGFSNVPRPVVGHGLIYICTGFMRPELLAIRETAQGEIGESDIVFRVKRQIPAQPSPVLVGQEIFLVSDQGIATCLDALTGEQLWQERVEGNYSSSPLAADGKVYFSNREGQTTVIRPGRTYDKLAVNKLDGQLMASPAAIDGRLLLRSESHLYLVGR